MGPRHCIVFAYMIDRSDESRICEDTLFTIKLYGIISP
jgi:hypothetical protein